MSAQKQLIAAEEAIPAEPVPDLSADELMTRKFVHRIRKLRWMGMEDAARALEMELRNAPFARMVPVSRAMPAATSLRP